MKKPLQGVKKDFKVEIKGIKLLAFFFSFSVSLLPQVPINGFCSIEHFPVDEGYDRLMISDINNDLQNDLLLFSPASDKICVIENEKDSLFSKTKLLRSSENISQMLSVKNNKSGTPENFFISRKQRIIGCLDVTKYGRLNLISTLSFDSYPGNIRSGDINDDGNQEFLISGSGFKGLSIISFDSSEFAEEKIEDNFSYSEAIFADISNDDYPDITAFNLFNYELEIFFNDAFGDFNKTRTIKLNSSIDNLSSIDINDDYYTDLIYCTDNSIDILWGDFQSSYESGTHLTTEYFPHCYSVADFNSDGFNDIAYIDSSQGLLSIFFGKRNEKFYPELLYYKKEGLVDLQILKTGKNNSLVLLNRQGEVSTISKIKPIENEVTLVPAIQPAAVSVFDFGNNGIPDFCITDEYMQTLNFIINSRMNFPSVYFSVPLSDNHQIIEVCDDDPFNKGFYCYTTGHKMLEIIDCDFNDYNFDISQLYIPGPVRDVKIKNVRGIVQIFVAFEDKDMLRVNEYEYHDFRYTVREYSVEDLNTIDPLLSVHDDPVIYYWKAGKDSLIQYSMNILSGSSERNQIASISRSNISGIPTIVQSVLSSEDLLINSLFLSGMNLFSVVTNDKIFKISNSIFDENNFNINHKLKLYFKPFDGEKYNSIFYSGSNNQFNKIDINISSNELAFQELFEAEDVTGYIRQGLSGGEDLLLYTQILEGKILLRLLAY